MTAWYQDPFNFLGKWAAWPLRVHIGIGLVLLLLTSAPIFWSMWTQQQGIEQQRLAMKQKQTEIAQQQKILAALQKRADSQQLSPELAALVVPINQRVQQLANHYQLTQTSRWEFTTQPLLQLNLTGYFNKTRPFLTALLQAEPRLRVLRLQMHKDEQSALQTELLLLLKKEAE